MKRNKLHILHCPTYGAANPGMLATKERQLGLVSRSVSIEPAVYHFYVDWPLNPFRSGWLSLGLRELLRWPLLLFAAIWADVIHYNFGQTIMPQWYGAGSIDSVGNLKRGMKKCLELYMRLLERGDVAILKALGKKIVITYQGDDARQGDYCRKHYEVTAANYVDESYYSDESDSNKRRLIAKISRYADKIYALNPDLLHVLPVGAQFMPYASVDLNVLKPAEQHANSRPLVIHAPTHRGVKGTDFVIAAVEHLKSEGVDFDFQLIENLSHDEALELYARADLLVDQLLIGWYGGLAVELMAMGKPVICYIREDDLCYLPEQMRRDLPIINANPGNIYQVLKQQLLSGEGSLKEIGTNSRNYVESWHDPLKIAKLLKADYEILCS